jgi:hypothetical protein
LPGERSIRFVPLPDFGSDVALPPPRPDNRNIGMLAALVGKLYY